MKKIIRRRPVAAAHLGALAVGTLVLTVGVHGDMAIVVMTAGQAVAAAIAHNVPTPKRAKV